MKNKSIVWMLALMGLNGCAPNSSRIVDVESDNDKTAKVDTALVLSAWQHAHNIQPIFLVVTKDGSVIEIEQRHSYKNANENVYWFSEVGDTVLIAGVWPDSLRIVRNITMENKIKAFSRQK